MSAKSKRAAPAPQPTSDPILEGFINTGNACFMRGDFVGAFDNFHAAHLHDPRNVAAIVNLASTLGHLGRTADAVEVMKHAVPIAPRNPEIFYNLGVIHASAHQLSEAARAYRTTVRLAPNHARAWSNLGTTLMYLGDLDGAIKAYRQSVRADPTIATSWSNLLYCQNYDDRTDKEALFTEHVRYGQRFGGKGPVFRQRRPDDPERKLRIGYISPDIRVHAVTNFLAETPRFHDRDRFSVHFYAEIGQIDEVTQRYQSFADGFRITAGQPHEAVAHQIAEDGIDILIDLAGHTANNRLAVLGYKPAPIQVTWLGYSNTTGLKEVDYLLGNPVTIPPAARRLYTETVWDMPGTSAVYHPGTDMTPSPEPPVVRTGTITFGCYNNSYKINPDVAAVWSRILHAVPDSRLLLRSMNYSESATIEAVFALFAKHRVPRERVIFAPPLRRPDYLASYNEVDIALDTFPYNGGTTTYDTLWMSVPVIAMAGNAFLERVTASVLEAIGAPELVAADRDAYVAKAVELASHIDRIAAYRGKLHESLKGSHLCNAGALARDLDQAFRQMWRIWCEKAG